MLHCGMTRAREILTSMGLLPMSCRNLNRFDWMLSCLHLGPARSRVDVRQGHLAQLKTAWLCVYAPKDVNKCAYCLLHACASCQSGIDAHVSAARLLIILWEASNEDRQSFIPILICWQSAEICIAATGLTVE